MDSWIERRRTGGQLVPEKKDQWTVDSKEKIWWTADSRGKELADS